MVVEVEEVGRAEQAALAAAKEEQEVIVVGLGKGEVDSAEAVLGSRRALSSRSKSSIDTAAAR